MGITRSDAERIRAREHVSRLRASLNAIELDIETRNHPPGINAAQAVTEAAVSLAMTMAKLDAYARAEDDLRALTMRKVDEFNCTHNVSIDPDTGECGTCGTVLP